MSIIKNAYPEITDKYIKIQEELGIKDPLTKFVEWRLYVCYFGKQLFPKDQEYLHKLAKRITTNLPKKYHDALLYWLNHERLSNNISKAKDDLFAHFLLGMVGVSSTIFDTKEIDIDPIKDDIDLQVEAMFAQDVGLSQIPNTNNEKVDLRLIELLEWETHRFFRYPKMTWRECLNCAREIYEYLIYTKEKHDMIPYFINDEGYENIIVNNYRFTDFIERFFDKNDKDDLFRPIFFAVISAYLTYIECGFDDGWVRYQLHRAPVKH